MTNKPYAGTVEFDAALSGTVAALRKIIDIQKASLRERCLDCDEMYGKECDHGAEACSVIHTAQKAIEDVESRCNESTLREGLTDEEKSRVARNAVTVLNRALEKDPEAVRALFSKHIFAPRLLDDETILVDQDSGVGVLGILNGIIGLNDHGTGYIAGAYDLEDPPVFTDPDGNPKPNIENEKVETLTKFIVINTTPASPSYGMNIDLL